MCAVQYVTVRHFLKPLKLVDVSNTESCNTFTAGFLFPVDGLFIKTDLLHHVLMHVCHLIGWQWFVWLLTCAFFGQCSQKVLVIQQKHVIWCVTISESYAHCLKGIVHHKIKVLLKCLTKHVWLPFLCGTQKMENKTKNIQAVFFFLSIQ